MPATFEYEPNDICVLRIREALAEIARVTVANITAFATGEPFLPGTTLPCTG
jgi:hypothetical protein